MTILIVSATEAELAPFAAALRAHSHHRIQILTTGVGMVATAAWCSRTLAEQRYDLALNLGVCGSFDRVLPPGAVVHVIEDRISELGAEDGEQFLTLEGLGLAPADPARPAAHVIVNTHPPASPALRELPVVAGLTVNTAHGNERSIARVLERVGQTGRPLVESMEGAAFMYACAIHGVPFAQVRAVSNVVERRNRAAWKMEEAISNLGTTAIRILDTLG